MFELNQKLNRLDIPAQQVLRLKRSLGDVQIALPGQQSQMATAYICAFSAGKGARVAIALHLHDDYKLIYYLNDGGEILSSNAGKILNQALDFSESLGFMMNDLDIHQMSGDEKKSFWESLPLKNPPVKPKPAAESEVPGKIKAVAGGSEGAIGVGDIIEEAEELSSTESMELDLGLPRRKLTSGGSRNKRPSAAELEKKRVRLRQRLGRFLSSL